VTGGRLVINSFITKAWKFPHSMKEAAIFNLQFKPFFPWLLGAIFFKNGK
jgi:HD-like signal output (HDOD) protein